MNPKTRKAVEALDRLFSDPSHHTSGEYARHKNGNPIGPLLPNAVCWCFVGGCMKVSNHDHALEIDMREALNLARERDYSSFTSLVRANDVGGLSVVRGIIQEALENG